jgi:hypothetical protein
MQVHKPISQLRVKPGRKAENPPTSPPGGGQLLRRLRNRLCYVKHPHQKANTRCRDSSNKPTHSDRSGCS